MQQERKRGCSLPQGQVYCQDVQRCAHPYYNQQGHVALPRKSTQLLGSHCRSV